MEGVFNNGQLPKLEPIMRDGGYSVTGQKTLLKNINIKILMTCLALSTID